MKELLLYKNLCIKNINLAFFSKKGKEKQRFSNESIREEEEEESVLGKWFHFRGILTKPSDLILLISMGEPIPPAAPSMPDYYNSRYLITSPSPAHGRFVHANCNLIKARYSNEYNLIPPRAARKERG